MEIISLFFVVGLLLYITRKQDKAINALNARIDELQQRVLYRD